jgi:hypothetical protein
MIGAAGHVAFRRGARAGWDLNAEAHLPLEGAHARLTVPPAIRYHF